MVVDRTGLRHTQGERTEVRLVEPGLVHWYPVASYRGVLTVNRRHMIYFRMITDMAECMLAQFKTHACAHCLSAAAACEAQQRVLTVRHGHDCFFEVHWATKHTLLPALNPQCDPNRDAGAGLGCCLMQIPLFLSGICVPALMLCGVHTAAAKCNIWNHSCNKTVGLHRTLKLEPVLQLSPGHAAAAACGSFGFACQILQVHILADKPRTQLI